MHKADGKTALILLALALLLTSGTPSAAPGFWEAATQADFLRGDVDQLSIDEHGRLMLGPEVRRVHDAGVPFVWTMVPGPDGSVFLGTGNDGKVVRVDRDGNGSVFFDSGEMEVHALAPAPNGGLYVGTSPDGRIYRVDAKGQATPFFDPDDKYIWALAVDPKGMVYAATGDKGVVYRITPDGKGTPFFTTKTTHAIALAFDAKRPAARRDGLAGPRVSRRCAGQRFSPARYAVSGSESAPRRSEGRAVRRGAERQAVTGRRRDAGLFGDRTRTPAAPVPTVSSEITSIAIIDVPVTPQPASSGGASGDRRGPTGAVYRVLPDGLWDQLWESRDDAPYDVALEPDGSLLVATGGKGKIFRLAGDPMRPTLLTRVNAQQATMLLRTRDADVDHDVESRASRRDLGQPRRERQLRIRREGREDGRHLGRACRGARRCPPARASKCERDRATRARRTKPGATGRRRTPPPTARPSPARRRAICSGAPC